MFKEIRKAIYFVQLNFCAEKFFFVPTPGAEINFCVEKRKSYKK